MILDFVNVAIVERQNLGLWIAEQDCRMAGNDKLRVCVLPEYVVDQHHESELALGRECCFRLVQEEQSIPPEL